MSRTPLLALTTSLMLLLSAAPPAAAADAPASAPSAGAPQKVLRYAFRVAETTLDPAQASDI